jgi:hypothetical protein
MMPTGLSSEAIHRGAPLDRAGLRAAIDTAGRREPGKRLLALLRPAVARRVGQAVHRQSGQAGFDEMVVRQLDELEVVGGHVGNALGVGGRVGVGAADRDHRQPGSGQRVAHGRVVVVGDDAVAPPLRDAGQAGAKVLLEEQVPFGACRAQVGADAGNDLAVVDLVGVEQQRHMVRRGWRLAAGLAASARTVRQGIFRGELRQKR